MRFANNRQRNNINRLINATRKYFCELLEEYHLDASLNKLCIINPENISKESMMDLYDRNIWSGINENYSVTNGIYQIGLEDDINDDSCIIKQVVCCVFMKESTVASILIDCNLDFDVTLQCLKFIIRHEVGHVLHHNTYVGKSLGEVKSFIAETDQAYESFNPSNLRSNASKKRRMDHFIAYNQLQPEAIANKLVGIDYYDQYQFINSITG